MTFQTFKHKCKNRCVGEESETKKKLCSEQTRRCNEEGCPVSDQDHEDAEDDDEDDDEDEEDEEGVELVENYYEQGVDEEKLLIMTS